MNRTGSGAAKRKSYAVLLVTTILAMFLTKAALAEPFDAPLEGEITSIVCPFKQELEYDVGRVKCGLINVPENRDKPDSRMIQLLYAHIVASARLDSEDDDEPEEVVVAKDDSVVYLTGGPGVSIDPYVERFLEHDLTKSRDLYILNQRGIGKSDEFCPFFSVTSRENLTAITLAESEAEELERTKACFANAKAKGIDLTGYNTVENARDVRALRLALGFERWNVWGISYGSHLGQMLTQVDAQGIRALVLDAIVPNDLGDLMRIHRWLARNHRLIFDECDRQDASICEGLEEVFYTAYNEFAANPLIVDALDEDVFPSGKYAVPALFIGFATFSMQYEQDEHPAIPSVMRALIKYAEERDPEIFQVFTLADDEGGIVSQGMSNAIRCNDGYVAAQAQIAEQDLQEEYGFTQGAFTVQGAQALARMCEESGLAPRDRKDYQLVQSDIPTLIVNGDWDPITPPPLAERIAPGFSNGRLIIVPYAGHGPTRSMSECGAQVMGDFFDDPSQDLSALDASCLEKGVDAPEFLDYMQTDAALRLATRAGDDPKRLLGPSTIIGATFLTVLIGFFAIIAGYIARRFSSQTTPHHAIGPVMPRLLSLLTSLMCLCGLALLGAGAATTIDISELSIVAGLAPPAKLGAFMLSASVVLGLYALYAVIAEHQRSPLRRRTIIGLPLICISAIVLAIYLMTWGVTVW